MAMNGVFRCAGAPIVIVALSIGPSASAKADKAHRPTPYAKRWPMTQAGFLVTTMNTIRIDSWGEVISKPAPIIEKERRFDERARKELSGHAP